MKESPPDLPEILSSPTNPNPRPVLVQNGLHKPVHTGLGQYPDDLDRADRERQSLPQPTVVSLPVRETRQPIADELGHRLVLKTAMVSTWDQSNREAER